MERNPTTQETTMDRSPITPALSSCAIVPSDFCKITTDVNYRRWSAGAMRLVVEALDGAPVAITTDTQTGHTAMNVRLTGVTETRSGGVSVIVQHVDGQYNSAPKGTAYPLANIGVILPLTEEGADAKWKATKAQHVVTMALVAKARAEHGEGRYGKWETRLGAYGEATVSFDPAKNCPEGQNVGELGRYAYWRFSRDEVEAAIAEDTARMEAYRAPAEAS